MRMLATTLLSADQDTTARASVPEPEPEGERTAGPGSESRDSRLAAVSGSTSGAVLASSEGAEVVEDDRVLLDESVLRMIQHCTNGPEWMTPFWWDVTCGVGWVGALWTATRFYGVYIPGMRLASGFAAFVTLLPWTWVPVCRTLRNEVNEGEGGGFVAQQLQQPVSRDTAQTVHRSVRIMWGFQMALCFACVVQNLTIGFGVPGLSSDIVFGLIVFGIGFPLGAARFVGMLATVVACARSVSDRIQEVERRCARHHEVLQMSSRAAQSATSSSSQLVAETESLLSTGRELGALLATAHGYVLFIFVRSAVTVPYSWDKEGETACKRTPPAGTVLTTVRRGNVSWYTVGCCSRCCWQLQYSACLQP